MGARTWLLAYSISGYQKSSPCAGPNCWEVVPGTYLGGNTHSLGSLLPLWGLFAFPRVLMG